MTGFNTAIYGLYTIKERVPAKAMAGKLSPTL